MPAPTSPSNPPRENHQTQQKPAHDIPRRTNPPEDLEALGASPAPPSSLSDMAERQLTQLLGQLVSQPSPSYQDARALLSKAKLALLSLNALTPAASVPPHLLALARD